MDRLSKPQRSWIMAQIKSCNTRPEIIVRSALHRLGFRFRLNYKKLPCKPDIVLPRLKVAIFVHGCFWHQHSGCKISHVPKSQTHFWQKKFLRNIARDNKNEQLLLSLGWRVITIWECQTRDLNHLTALLSYELAGKKMASLREEATEYDSFS